VTKKILFLTGTRADFGKLKPLIRGVSNEPALEYVVVATGMHLDDRYGRTEIEITKSGFSNLVSFSNSGSDDAMDLTLARTITGLSPIIQEHAPDLLVVHGDRVEALAGAITGSLNNILVAHVEGGELSGTVDESIRHAVTKLAHVHFVANQDARKLLIQLGENPASIFVIGSPEIDIMLSPSLPPLDEVLHHYQIPFRDFAILIFHPVTTETSDIKRQIQVVLEVARSTNDNYVVIYPNNDHGSELILQELMGVVKDLHFRLLPSIRFEAFQTLLKSASYILGNSSSGVREAPVHGVPAVNVGTRQNRRVQDVLIINSPPLFEPIKEAIVQAKATPRRPSRRLGDGSSSKHFIRVLKSDEFWRVPVQKEIHLDRRTKPD